MPWFRELSAEDRSWVGLIVQAGIRGFVDWYRHDGEPVPPAARPRVRRLRRRPARAGRRDQPPADRRPGPALASRSSRATSTTILDPADAADGARGACCATPARSPSPPPRSTPAPPRSAAPGTPGSRRWSSTRCCAPRPTRPCSPGPAPSAGARRGDVAVVLGAGPAAAHRDRPVRRGTPARPGPPGMDALVRGPGRPAGRRARRRRRRRARPREPVVDLLRRRPGGGRPGRRRPRPAPTSPPGPRSSALPRRRRAGPRRRARCAATTCCPSGPWPATATPGGTWSTRSTCRCCRPAATLIETLAAYFDHGGSIEAHRPGAVRAPQHGPLPAAAGRRPHRAARPPTPGTRSRCGSPWCWAGSRAAATGDPIFVGILQRIAAAISCAPEASGGPGHGRVGARARHRRSRPRRPDPRLPRALARGPDVRRPRFEWLSAVAGLDLVHYGTEADADTIRDTADRPAAAGRHRPGRGARAVPAPGRRVRARSAPSPATASASSTAAAGARRDHRRAGDGAGPRARQGDGRGRRRRPRPA